MSALNDVQWQRWYCVFYQRWLNVSCHSSSTLSATLTFMELPQMQSDTNTVSQMQQNNHPQQGGSPPLSFSLKLYFSWFTVEKFTGKRNIDLKLENSLATDIVLLFFLMAGWCHGAMGLDSRFMGYTFIFCTYESRNNVPFPITVIYTCYSHFPTAIKRNVKEHFFDDCCQINQTLMPKNILKIVFNSLAF